MDFYAFVEGEAAARRDGVAGMARDEILTFMIEHHGGQPVRVVPNEAPLPTAEAPSPEVEFSRSFPFLNKRPGHDDADAPQNGAQVSMLMIQTTHSPVVIGLAQGSDTSRHSMFAIPRHEILPPAACRGLIPGVAICSRTDGRHGRYVLALDMVDQPVLEHGQDIRAEALLAA